MRRNLLFTGLGLLTSGILLASCSTLPSSGVWKQDKRASTQQQQRPYSTHAPYSPYAQQPATDAPQPMDGAVPVAKSKVALLLPLSGRGKDIGQAMMNASQLAMFDMNASDLFELIPEDTGTGAAQAAQDALNGGASLILGPLFSDDTKAVAPYAVPKGVSVVSFSTDTTAATGTTFLMGFVPQTQVQQILAYAGSQGKRRIALIAPRNAYGNVIASSFYAYLQRAGLTNVGMVRYDSRALPTAEQLAELTRVPVDAVLIATGGRQAAQISAAMSARGLMPNKVQRLGTTLWDDGVAQSLPELQGAWYAASPAVLRTRFERRYVDTYGVKPPRLASLAYDATALAVVLSKSGHGFGRTALTNPNGFAGVDGIFRFRPDGLADRGLEILEIKNGRAATIQSAPSSFFK